ncbi:RagB/SusD family nutrient uptake outer membrane protein [Flavobacterium sp. UMI-01]|uniref:RagB/SusD family nutrient uptake outer membrane protein n=1 Tax=Flavobacterium sp. UMI-01 TaxID=1441053 RepID=UPI001C7D6996|nr:RagB/SusD family nutrient uptake outer membrane protein [Flavobacterium sp. UMI-01]GIZ09713.1 hypothetical protein FUMI01_24400 [Flavobacterium sp. UMI-01]
MKNKYIKLITVVSVSLLVSCALEPEIDNTFNEDFALTLPENTEGFLMNAYANLANTAVSDYGNEFLDAATDNAVTNNFAGSIYKVGTGSLTPNTNPIGSWDNAYTQFRNIHLFLEHGLGDNVKYDLVSPANDALKKKNLNGEAHFLRAWWGFHLLQAYGGKTVDGQALGYPIVLRTLTEEESRDLKSIKRNTYEECVAQIISDLDVAIANLPLQYTGTSPILGISQLGRADKKTAMALRSRVSLYAASPAYQPNSITTITGMGQFTVNNTTAYINKWRTAAIHAQEAITTIGAFSSLKATDFNSNTTPPEFIWRSFFTSSLLENLNYPVNEFGQARTGPSQNLVDAFYTKNGFPITDSRSGYDPNNPYANRDPRLYLNVLHNGSDFNNRQLEIFEGGKDSRSKVQGNTRTGYYVRKWLSLTPNLKDVNAPSTDRHYNPYFRRTEMYLNLAEAANEAYGPTGLGDGVTQTAVAIIKSIRTNAQITSNTYVDEVAAMGKAAFRKLIQNERRLELAFENHRYFDMRRWVLPLNEVVQGVKITKNPDNSLTYNKIDVEARNLNDIKYYYAPLPYAELAKSPNLVNNIGW